MYVPAASRIGLIRHLYCCYIHEILSQQKSSWKEWTVHANLEKALGHTGWRIFRGMMTLWSLSHFCAEKIKILIVQYAVITEQTSSPRAFSHLSAFRQNLRCNSLLLSLSFSVTHLFHPSFFLSSVLLSHELSRWRKFTPARSSTIGRVFRAASFACWNRRERSFSWMELE